ncbi:alkaline phosphatase [Amphiplicatus metriothermophilus]|uniref:Alkaline phosphatase n=1 Tax=Amphiplicatus metriothermophilus TaxID=1519374 RepID=A0A239PQS8_9PROT|nr:alkaline phosphatase [Amphiplicatus metriothermophilus]MBB5518435.1 alkaline phosphatase [Amphiplicatus metriothermophilus]SNT72403.1 alkaline phosphatase [Amphiplicatus metriothermophilus]
MIKALFRFRFRPALAAVLAGSTALAACAHIGGDAPDAAGAQTGGRATNVILFVGDGMGVSTVTAIRILEGQMRGEPGEENMLSWETFPHVALSKTYNVNQQVPDSAGTATAMLSGVKTKAGFIGVGPAPARGDCAGALRALLPTLMEQAEAAGLAAGVVTTTRLTHATPAAAFAHVPERDWESDADMPQDALAAGCRDIARQLIEFPYGDGIDVALGGGRANFMPESAADPEYPDRTGKRRDGRDLVAAWLDRPGARYVWNKAQFDALDPVEAGPVLGLFEPSHMQYELDRAEDAAGEPSLAEMTAKAIELLRRKPGGFALLVEGGRIDHAHHAGRAALALHDGVAMAEAVKVADAMTDDADTLIIVTADHSHVLTIAGYPTRGNPILGKVVANDARGEPQNEPARLQDGLPYTTLGYHNGPGAVRSLPRPDISDVDTQHKDYRQQALLPIYSETHAGEDVPVYAKGPGAERVRGVMEQNEIYDALAGALGLGGE